MISISTLATSKNRLLVCSSHFGTIFEIGEISQGQKPKTIGELKLDHGPAVASASNEEYFATVHHQKRALCLWRARDAKLMWSTSLDGVPSSVVFNCANSGKEFSRLSFCQISPT